MLRSLTLEDERLAINAYHSLKCFRNFYDLDGTETRHWFLCFKEMRKDRYDNPHVHPAILFYRYYRSAMNWYSKPTQRQREWIAAFDIIKRTG